MVKHMWKVTEPYGEAYDNNEMFPVNAKHLHDVIFSFMHFYHEN